METKKEKLKCEHEYKMGNDLGLIKICHKCGAYFTTLINQNPNEKRWSTILNHEKPLK